MRKTRQERFGGSLTREQQTRVRRAVYAGRALTDPEEAEAAVRLARILLRRRPSSWRRAGRSLLTAATVIYLAGVLVLFLRRGNGSVPSWTTVLVAFCLVVHLYTWLSAPGRWERIAQAERFNLQLVEEASGISVELEKPGFDTSQRVSGPAV